MGQHADERIHTKKIDLPAHEVADPRLRDPQTFSSLLLCQARLLDMLFEFDHQHRTQLVHLRLFLGKPQLHEYVVAHRAFFHGQKRAYTKSYISFN